VSDILVLSNAHTSMGAAFALRMFAPSEPTRFGLAMKIYKHIFAALTSLTFHVKHAIASVATKYLYFGITEHEHVGLWLCQSPNMTQSVKGMDVYLTIEPFQEGFLCAAVAVPLLQRFSWSHYL
jgi:hypothetical protein